MLTSVVPNLGHQRPGGLVKAESWVSDAINPERSLKKRAYLKFPQDAGAVGLGPLFENHCCTLYFNPGTWDLTRQKIRLAHLYLSWFSKPALNEAVKHHPTVGEKHQSSPWINEYCW